MTDQARTLANIPLFKFLDAEFIQGLDRQCQWRRAQAGTWVVDYGDQSSDVFFILHGRLRVMILSGQREVILRDLAEGEFFGELAAIDGLPRSAGIVAVTDAVIGRLPAPLFRQTYLQNPEVSERLLLLLAAEVRKLAARVNEFSCLNVGPRVRAELLRLVKVRRDGVAAISPPPTHAELAARVSTHREAVTRELKALERAGLIERRKGAIVILQMEALRRTVEAEDN